MARGNLNRGEIWLVDLGMAQKVRPAVILSIRYLDHERALVTYVPRTTSLRETRFEVAHEARNFNPGAFDAQSIGSMPPTRFVRHIATLDAETLRKVEESVRAWLAI
jgi:mRNA interferase MazF